MKSFQEKCCQCSLWMKNNRPYLSIGGETEQNIKIYIRFCDGVLFFPWKLRKIRGTKLYGLLQTQLENNYMLTRTWLFGNDDIGMKNIFYHLSFRDVKYFKKDCPHFFELELERLNSEKR